MDWPRRVRTRDAISVIARGWIVILALGLVGALAALGWCLLKQPVYEATVTLYVTSGTNNNATSAYEDSMGSQQRVPSYASVVYTDSVLIPALKSTGLDMSLGQVRAAVTAVPVRGAALLTVGAKDSNPEVARRLANAVADSLTENVAALDSPTGGGLPASRLTALNSASVDPKPTSPKTYIIVTLGASLGLFLGLVAVLGRERFNNTVRDERDAEAAAGSQVIARIPDDSTLRKSSPVDFADSNAAVADVFREIRSAVSIARPDGATIVVASPRSDDGKSVLALNLAEAFRESRRSVVLVDANLAGPVIAKRLGVREQPGLSDVLLQTARVSDALQQGPTRGPAVLTSGAPAGANPADLLASKVFTDMLRELRNNFDFVVIDTASLMNGVDATEVARRADSVLLVVRLGRSKLSEVIQSAKSMSTSGTEVIGVVINDARVERRHQRAGRKPVPGSDSVTQ